MEQWTQQDSNLQPTSYASPYGFRRPHRKNTVCGLDSLFTLFVKPKMGCLPSSLYTFALLKRRLARDYHDRF
jgi:hypothetical protein